MASILAVMANASNHYLFLSNSGFMQCNTNSLKWTRSQLFLMSRLLQQQQGVNLWNGFVRAQLKEANEDREKGERFKLTEFIAQNKTELDCTYSKLTVVQEQVYKGQILEAHEKKQWTARANPKAVQHDINASLASMDHEGFYIAVRGGIEDLSEPKVFFTQKAEKFIKDILHMEPWHLGLKLESYVISGLDEGVTPNCQRPLNKIISECHTFIQDALKSILLKKNIKCSVKMNYTNYECKIVERHGVELVNWPLSGPVRNPSKVSGRNEVEKLWGALDKGTCHWVNLSDDDHKAQMQLNRERHTRGELVYVKRKQKRTKTSHSTIDIDTEDKNDDSDSSSSNLD
ncbi:hypothetical protein BD769DRAFT_1395678 [Suillus cothurnatus]|nr:hypothetical protein BD769DRAFT_1395678 [Suillus cothurnatus]